MPEITSVSEAPVADKRVLLHTDFDVPLQEGKVLDDTRIKAALPTIKLLQEKGAASIIIISKLGRPGGKVVEGLRMAPVAARLAELIDMKGIEVRENLRFDSREEAHDEAFAKELAALGDMFVNEAFADSHRAHASIVGIPKFLPSYAGLHFIEEVEHITAAQTPPPGSIAVIGGAKFETKEPLLTKLASTYEKILLGGALANDVLKARGNPIGASLTSQRPVPPGLAQERKLLVPEDSVVVEDAAGTEREALINDTRAHERIVDIGPRTAAAWAEVIATAPFVLWNGPMGVYEQGYTHGTDLLAQALVKWGARAVIGGGDTAAALKQFTFDPARIFVSTGGGAMLQLITDGTLPGIEALKR